MGGWFKREVNGLSDMTQMRIPVWVGRSWTNSEKPCKLFRRRIIHVGTGAIDATEWVGPYDDENGFSQGCQVPAMTGWWSRPFPLLLCQRQRMGKPAVRLQTIFTKCKKQKLSMTARYDALNPAALPITRWRRTNRPFAQELLDKAFTVAKNYWKKMRSTIQNTLESTLHGKKPVKKHSVVWYRRSQRGSIHL